MKAENEEYNNYTKILKMIKELDKQIDEIESTKITNIDEELSNYLKQLKQLRNNLFQYKKDLEISMPRINSNIFNILCEGKEERIKKIKENEEKFNHFRKIPQHLILVHDNIDITYMSHRKDDISFKKWSEYNNSLYKHFIFTDKDNEQIAVEYCIFDDTNCIFIYIYCYSPIKRQYMTNYILNNIDLSKNIRNKFNYDCLNMDDYTKWVESNIEGRQRQIKFFQKF